MRCAYPRSVKYRTAREEQFLINNHAVRRSDDARPGRPASARFSSGLTIQTMSAENDLQTAYAEWQRLAEAEGQAIRAGNWSFVAECQQAINQLRPTIENLTSKANEEARLSGVDITPQRHCTRGTVLNLIELQPQTLLSLEPRRQRLANHIEQLSRTSRNLQDIQRSGTPAAPAAWSSYS
jgi:hypothetical protein